MYDQELTDNISSLLGVLREEEGRLGGGVLPSTVGVVGVVGVGELERFESE